MLYLKIDLFNGEYYVVDDEDPRFYTELYGREDGSWIVVTARCGNTVPPVFGGHRLLCGLGDVFTLLYREWDGRKPHFDGLPTQELIARRVGTSQQSVSRYANQLSVLDVTRINWKMEDLVKFYFETFTHGKTYPYSDGKPHLASKKGGD